MIEHHVATAPLATMLLQRVRASDLEQLYATVKLAPASVQLLHAVIGRALKIAVRDRLIVANPAAAVEDRPRASKDHGLGARERCWSPEEARRVLTAAKTMGPQASAFFAVLLDTGCRKSEALGLIWADVDLDSGGTLTITRQLEPRSHEQPVWGPTKTGHPRVVTLGAETLARLKAHKKSQAELKMKNRTVYQDHGLVFAKEATDLQTPTAALGQPCRALVTRHFRQVVKAAGVRRIPVHGTRHTAATLLLSAGVPVQVVAQRLGHATVAMTLEVYAHATTDLQADAAVKLNTLLTRR